jgi:hypothetical protein
MRCLAKHFAVSEPVCLVFTMQLTNWKASLLFCAAKHGETHICCSGLRPYAAATECCRGGRRVDESWYLPTTQQCPPASSALDVALGTRGDTSLSQSSSSGAGRARGPRLRFRPRAPFCSGAGMWDLPEGELHMAPLLRRTAFAHVVLGLTVSSVMMVGFGVGGGRTEEVG